MAAPEFKLLQLNQLNKRLKIKRKDSPRKALTSQRVADQLSRNPSMSAISQISLNWTISNPPENPKNQRQTTVDLLAKPLQLQLLTRRTRTNSKVYKKENSKKESHTQREDPDLKDKPKRLKNNQQQKR